MPNKKSDYTTTGNITLRNYIGGSHKKISDPRMTQRDKEPDSS